MENLTWFGWYYLILFAVGVVVAILTIDRPRAPRTPGEALAYIVWGFFNLWGLFSVGLVHSS